ncbi:MULTISPECIES: shikimate dehydrogenase [unclassified Pseudomonas]|uniref:shikimate dehydrogenase family protein n=1 Tax=unclassified Pseudomonas TaxID=196821 RepID=UPI00129E1C7D|nr:MULTISPECIES: shikimate dehydrogenase [unclassified Pseudomonas]MDH4652297.1 shikimate dehydrogenase [Pseudomonas sp. BN606]MRK24307.1 shikimate dehydrogenase [Pseudomonas sp. JG-B]
MIRGSTELVAIIGSPIAQVKSPENFNAWFTENDQDLAMIAVDMAEQNLATFIQSLRGWKNLRGCVVTVPYKQVLASQLDQLSPRAAALGSVNVIRREADGRLLGDNVDGEGFLKAARAHGFQPAGQRVLVVGSGGVGAAIAYSLCEGSVRQLVIADLDQPRAEALAKHLRDAFPQIVIGNRYDNLEAFDLVANATPVGMGGTGEMPLPGMLLETLSPTALVADVVTSPVVTPLLELARRLGCRIQTGPEMARAQMGNLGAHMGVMPQDA